MNKVIMLFIIAFVMTSTLTGYGMWFQNLRSNVYVKTGDIDWKITSHLVFVFHDCHCHCDCGCDHFHKIGHEEVSVTSDNHTISISINFTHCHHSGDAEIWAGLIIKNTGNIPVKITGMNVTAYGDYSNINYNYYMYGPYSTEDLENECNWSNTDPDDLPFSDYASSIILDPGEIGIVWLHISIEDGEDHILVTIKPIVSLWNK